jgi:hypothetical protein
VPFRKLASPGTRTASEDANTKPGFWRTGLLLITSAALGGIAVAVWNRRTLAQFRQTGAKETGQDR